MSLESSEIKFLDRAFTQIKGEKYVALRELSYLRMTLDNPIVSEKVGGSYTGQIVELQIRAVARNTAMFCARMWDKNGHSLPQIAARLKNANQHIADSRTQKHPDWSPSDLGLPQLSAKIDRFHKEITQFKDSREYDGLRIARDEFLAHSLKDKSGFRKKHSDADDISTPTLNETCELSHKTLNLIVEAENIWKFSIHSIEDNLSELDRISEAYWEAFPTLSEVEIVNW